MKRFITLTVSVLFTISLCFAQDTLCIDTIVITHNPTDFTVSKRTFDEPVTHYLTSPDGKYEIFLFSKERKILVPKNRIEVYRKGSNEKLWEKSSNGGDYETTEFGIMERTANKVTMLDYATGNKIWAMSAETYCGHVENIVLFRALFGNLDGYSMETGKKVWKAKIDYEGGLCYSQIIDDTHDFLVTDNVYRIDWTDGSTQSIDAKTNITNKGAVALAFAGALAGAAVGAAMGAGNYVYIPGSYSYTTMHNGIFLPSSGYKISGIASPVVTDDKNYYFADRKSVKCFDKDTNVLWDVDCPGEKASKSELLVIDDKIYMVNFGFAMKNGHKHELGMPFVSALKASDGTQVFYNELTDKKKIMQDLIYNEDNVRMMFDTFISTLSFKDNSITQFTCDTTAYGMMRGFVDENKYFVLSGSSYFIPMTNLTPSRPVSTTKGYFLDIPLDNGQPEVICKSSQLYAIAGNAGDMTFIRGGLHAKDVWLVKGNTATMVSDEVKKIWIFEDKITILTLEGIIKDYKF